MSLHPLLERQLRQLGAAADAAPTADEWRAFLDRVNRSYEGSDRDRYLVERSLEISSTEMAELYDQLRRSSESELAAERDKLRTVIESVGDGLCVLDAEGTILFANPEARRLLAAPESDLSGRRLRDVVRIRQDGQDGQDGERILGEVWRDASTPRRHDDAVFDTTDGRSFPASYVLNPFAADDGPGGMVLVFRDVTARKRSESLLARSEAENRHLAAEQAALRRVATAVAAESDPAAVFSMIAREASSLLGVECGLVVRFEEDRGVPVGWWGSEQARLDVTFPLRGRGGLAQVYRNGRPARVADYAALGLDPVGQIALAGRYRSGVAAPVRVAGRPWGAVLAATTRGEPIAVDAEQRLAHFAELAALVVANADARAEIDRQHRALADRNARLEQQRTELRQALSALGAEKERLEAFYRFGERVASDLELGSLARTILGGVCRFAGADSGVLYAGEPARDGALPLAAAHGGGRGAPAALRAGEGAPGRALAERRTIEPDGLSGQLDDLGRPHRRELHVPLAHGAGALGVLSLVRAGAAPFATEDVAAIEHLCNHAAMALATALSLRRAQRQAELNRAVLETAHDASIISDSDGLIVEWNPQAERIFGWPRVDVLGRPLAETLIADGESRRQIADLLAGGEAPLPDRPLELQAVRRCGEPVPVEVTISRIPLGPAAGLHVFARDVSARKRAERYAAAQHAVTEVLAESSREEEARPRLLRTLGERLGCQATALWSVDTESDRLVCDELWADSVRTERAMRAVHEQTPLRPGLDAAVRAWRSGEAVVADEAGVQGLLCLPIRGEGAVMGVLGLMGPWAARPPDDLLATMEIVSGQLGQFFERRRAEREAERIKDEFLALVSHELRTPLTSILGYVEILSEEEAGPLVDEQRRFLEVLERNARRLLRLVGDLLFIAQFESGRFALDAVSELDLADLAAEALNAARPSANDRQIAVALSCAPNRSPLHGDRDRISQVLDNLISNAIKFTAAGGSVSVRVLQRDGEAIVEVADTGIGIPEAEHELLFQRFFRASSASQRHIAGVGLGLSIVRAIVEAHGGAIEFHSLQGAGTTFQVRLPLDPVGRARPDRRPSPHGEAATAAASISHHEKGTVR